MSQINASSITRPALNPQRVAAANQISRRTRGLVRKATVLAVAAAGIFAFVAGQSANASSDAVSVEFQHVTVHSGETLWQLAQQYGQGQDAREWIASVVDLNGLASIDIQPGQDLALPNN